MLREVHFEGFRFQPDTGRLWSDADEVRLTPKAAAVLAVLVGAAGEPVSKDQFFPACGAVPRLVTTR